MTTTTAAITQLPRYTTSVSDRHYIAGKDAEWFVIRKGQEMVPNHVVAQCTNRFDADVVCSALNVVEELRQRATDVFFDKR